MNNKKEDMLYIKNKMPKVWDYVEGLQELPFVQACKQVNIIYLAGSRVGYKGALLPLMEVCLDILKTFEETEKFQLCTVQACLLLYCNRKYLPVGMIAVFEAYIALCYVEGDKQLVGLVEGL